MQCVRTSRRKYFARNNKTRVKNPLENCATRRFFVLSTLAASFLRKLLRLWIERIGELFVVMKQPQICFSPTVRLDFRLVENSKFSKLLFTAVKFSNERSPVVGEERKTGNRGEVRIILRDRWCGEVCDRRAAAAASSVDDR